jgi:hypothetical protein
MSRPVDPFDTLVGVEVQSGNILQDVASIKNEAAVVAAASANKPTLNQMAVAGTAEITPPPAPPSHPITATPAAVGAATDDDIFGIFGGTTSASPAATTTGVGSAAVSTQVAGTVPSGDLLVLGEQKAPDAVTPPSPVHEPPATVATSSDATSKQVYERITAILASNIPNQNKEQEISNGVTLFGVNDPALQVFAAMCKGILAATGDGASDENKTAALQKVTEQFGFINTDEARDADQTNQSIVMAMAGVMQGGLTDAMQATIHQSATRVLAPIAQAARSQSASAVASPADVAPATPSQALATPAAATTPSTPVAEAGQSSPAIPAANHDADQDATKAGATAAAKGAAALILALAAGPAGWALAAGFLYVTRNVGVKKDGPKAPQEETMSEETKKCVDAYKAYEAKQGAETGASEAVTAESAGVPTRSSASTARASATSAASTVEATSTALGATAGNVVEDETAAVRVNRASASPTPDAAVGASTTLGEEAAEVVRSGVAAARTTSGDLRRASAALEGARSGNGARQTTANRSRTHAAAAKVADARLETEAAAEDAQVSVEVNDVVEVGGEEDRSSRPTMRQRAAALFSRRDGYQAVPDGEEETEQPENVEPRENSPSLRQRGVAAIRDFRRSRRTTVDPLLADTDDEMVELSDTPPPSTSRLGQMAATVRGVFSRGSSRVDPQEMVVEGPQGMVHTAGTGKGPRGVGGTGTRGRMEDDDAVHTLDVRVSPMNRAREAAAGIISIFRRSDARAGGADPTTDTARVVDQQNSGGGLGR